VIGSTLPPVMRLQRAQTLSFSSRTASAPSKRGFHGNEAEQLQHVVLHHVAQRAGLVVIAGAAFQSDGFGNGDLHVVDVGEFQRGSYRALAKRSAIRFCTVSLPR
jgi:hypothetical protein